MIVMMLIVVVVVVASALPFILVIDFFKFDFSDLLGAHILQFGDLLDVFDDMLDVSLSTLNIC